jgi:EAL and modified HD-GYP domain-containing signal transduction protein
MVTAFPERGMRFIGVRTTIVVTVNQATLHAPGPEATHGGATPSSICVARQPIFEANLDVFGYELLFRRAGADRAEIHDSEAATSRTVVGSLVEIGLETLVGEALALINVSDRFVLAGHAELVPRERVALELLEDATPTSELASRVRELRARGYTIALDDFVYDPAWHPLLEAAHIVKLEVNDVPVAELRKRITALAPFGVDLLAEKIEDHETFERCKALGFRYFQGYFLCRPRTMSADAVPSSQLSQLELASALRDPEVSIAELERVIAHDLGLSYRLLRYINSAHFALPRRIESIRQAVVLLGLRQVKNLASVLALAALGDTPSELLMTALVRARMCERAAEELRDGPDAAFTVGLFSLVDAILDRELDHILASLPLSSEIAEALLTGGGPHGRTLAAIIAHERGRFDEAAALMPGVDLAGAYVDAVAWANDAHNALRD